MLHLRKLIGDMMSEVRALVPTKTDKLVNLIVRREREIRYVGKSMLGLARAQGVDLLALKAECPHGTFMAAVARTGLSHSQAKKYMLVVKRTSQGPFDVSLGIDAFLDSQVEERKPKSTPTLTKVDAEYALKIAALADRGIGGEQQTAQTKLETLAKSFGMDVGELREKAQKLVPEAEMTSYQSGALAIKEEIVSSYRKMTKEELIEEIFQLLLKLHKGGIDV